MKPISSLLLFLLSFLTLFAPVYGKPVVPLLPSSITDGRDVSYSSVSQDQYLYYDDESGSRLYKLITGEVWSFYFETDKAAEEIKVLVKNLVKNGGTIIGVPSSITALSIAETPLTNLYFSIEDCGSEVTIVAMRERILPLEMTMDFTFTEDSSEYWFSIDSDGKEFITFNAEFDGKDIELCSWETKKTGKLSRYISYQQVLSANHGSKHKCFSIPQISGKRSFKVRNVESDQPNNLKLRYSKSVPVKQVKKGDKTGGLLVKGASWGTVTAIPEFGDTIEHPDFSTENLSGDRTPKGEALFWLPPGIWTVKVKPGVKSIESVKAHFVPVEPGRITKLTVPMSLASALAKEDDGKISILNTKGTSEVLFLRLGLIDSTIKNLTPNVENLTILEDGDLCPVKSIKPVELPMDIVLLLDSSGSMKGSMRQAVDSVKTFIKKLPDKAKIRVVDFDTIPKELPSKTRADLLKSLDSVISRGATCLFDSIVKGLEMLSESSRPTLIVFTDGVDANWNDTAPGSKATKTQVLEKAKESLIPVFTVGFGAKPDYDTLQRIATIGGGSYYGAKDEKALDRVFESIGKNLGNQYEVVCSRPPQKEQSNAPVVSMVVDNSGSMDMNPDNDGCDYRMEKVKDILYSAVLDMPSNFSGQVLTFTDSVEVEQVLTSDKGRMLRAISLMRGAGGTDILASVKASYDTLKTVPSNRRYLIYITDAAMAVSDEDKHLFHSILGQLKDSGIKCLWIGICENDEGQVFATAAKLSDGTSVVSNDLEIVGKAIKDFSKKIGEAPEVKEEVSISVRIANRSELGTVTELSTSTTANLPKPKKGEGIATPEEMKVTEGERLVPYEGDVSNFLSGDDTLVKDVRIQKRIELNISGKNKAVALNVKEAFFLTRLKGLEPPSGMRFLALTCSLKNILPPQKVAVFKNGGNHPSAWVSGAKPLRYENIVPDYVIPDLSRHIFLRLNNSQSYPVSELTWITQAPLTLPGEPAVAVRSSKDVTGTICFLVPTENVKQMSLHFFDTNYGHLDIPLTGTMTYSQKAYGKLPESSPAKLSDSFSLSVKGLKDQKTIGKVPAGEGFIFRVIELSLVSNIQAHLEIDPSERFTYRMHTHLGDLVYKLHPLTQALPLGFYRPSFVTPGDTNTLRLAFRIPEVLGKGENKGTVAVDVAGGGVLLPLSGIETEQVILESPNGKGHNLAVKIHESGLISSSVVGVEVSISDGKDSEHTRLGELIVLKQKDAVLNAVIATKRKTMLEKIDEASKTPGGLGSFTSYKAPVERPYGPAILISRNVEKQYIFGLDKNSVLPDGITRRGVLFFDLPEGIEMTDYSISSNILEGIDVPLVKDSKYTNPVLTLEVLPAHYYDNGSESFSKQLAAIVSRLKSERRTKNFVKPGQADGPKTNFSNEAPKESIPCPSWTGAIKDENKTSSYSDFVKSLKNLRLVSSEDSPWAYRFSEKAMETQGWYTQNEAAVFSEKRLNSEGLETERITVELTNEGIETLKNMAPGMTDYYPALPALRYTDSEDKEHVIVFPFFKEINELKGLVKYSQDVETCLTRPATAKVYVELTLVPSNDSKFAQTADAASALSGSCDPLEPENIVVISQDIELNLLSLDTLNLGFSLTPTVDGDILTTVLDGPMGRVVSTEQINTSQYDIPKMKITFDVPFGQHVINRFFDEPISNTFHSFGINIPDLPEDKIEEVEKLRKEAHEKCTTPDSLSAMNWFANGVITRFVGAQTKHERQIAKTLNLKIARHKHPRVIALHMSRKDEVLQSSLDLVSVYADILDGTKEARTAFNIQTGLFNARLEGKALPDGVSLFDIWDRAPSGSKVLSIFGENKEAFLEQLKGLKIGSTMIEHLQNTNDIVIFPSKPSMIKGNLRWAWLQINSDNYQITSHFDTGEHGAMVDHIVSGLLSDSLSYIIGAWKGVESSVWAVATFSLMITDYDELIEAAEKFVTGPEQKLISAGVGIGDAGTVSTPLVKLEVTTGGIRVNQNLLGFSNGYEAGIKLYFSMCK